MKTLFIEHIFSGTTLTIEKFIQSPDVTSVSINEQIISLNSNELLQIRDWVNERCRELQFHGYLSDSHIAD